MACTFNVRSYICIMLHACIVIPTVKLGASECRIDDKINDAICYVHISCWCIFGLYHYKLDGELHAVPA